MEYRKSYDEWINNKYYDEETKKELLAISNDEKEIEDRFHTSLAFGTGGLRGIIGAGTNRMNVYTVQKATQGLANTILKQGIDLSKTCVCIAHDPRRLSSEFAKQTALVLNGNGIKTVVFDGMRPTPFLSFVVQKLGAIAGVVITASHNPKEYNGYKAYWSDGIQLTSPRDEEVIDEVNKIADFGQVKIANYDEAVKNGLYTVGSKELDDEFIKYTKDSSLNPDLIKEHGKDLNIVYTPLNGAGNIFVRRVLKEMGFENVFVVKEQENPDPTFSTLAYPNPEDAKAFELALKLANEVNGDIVLATDPDSDRLGVVVKHNGEYVFINGNMIGTLMCEYIISQKQKNGVLPKDGAVISTVVSTRLTNAITDYYGLTYYDVLTGFKHIGTKMKQFEDEKSNSFLFAFEESYGTLAGPHVRDKDGVLAAVLMCEIALYYKQQGLSVIDALEKMYERYGFYKEGIETITLKGLDGLMEMAKIMANLRTNPPMEVNGTAITLIKDYKLKEAVNTSTGEKTALTLPVSDVLHYTLADGSWFCIRPSGTEPKIKIYFGVKGESAGDASKKLEALVNGAMALVEKAGK